MLTIVTDPQWAELFEQERTRLLTALGPITTGGVVDGIQHIGSTSVPGLPGSPCVDIALAVWPYPLEPIHQAALETLGYEALAGDDASEQRFRHQSGTLQLFLVEAGAERWTDYLLIRDYLRVDERAHEGWAAQAALGIPKPQRFEAILGDARSWWIGYYRFRPVEVVAEELEGLKCLWYISSGWALDLFLGRVTRVHHDVDVLIPRAAQLTLQRYMRERGWQWLTALERRLEPWPPQMELALPRHQAHAHREGAFIDFLLMDIEHDVWRYRRAPTIIRSAERMSLTAENGIPYLAPELVLLFKSRNTSGRDRSKDQTDFEMVHQHLEPERQAWLRWALMATEPRHPWLERLYTQDGGGRRGCA